MAWRRARTELSRELSRFYDYGWAAKVKDRVYRQRNGLLYRLLDLLWVLTGPLQVFFGFLLGIVLTFLTAAGDASPLPCTLAYLFYYLDDRALRRHIHSIPPQWLSHLVPIRISYQTIASPRCETITLSGSPVMRLVE
jgi:hypothetical protein